MTLLLRYFFLATITSATMLLWPSCQKPEVVADVEEPEEIIDSNSIHVYGQYIDSGFVFGRWTMICYTTSWVESTSPLQTITRMDCATRPLYEFKPNGLLYTYTYNAFGDTTVLDSAIYWYLGAGNRLFTIAYQTEINDSGRLQYRGVGAITEQMITYRNDSMYWREITGGITETIRNFVRKD